MYIYIYITCTLGASLRWSNKYIKYLGTCTLGTKARAIKFKYEKETTWAFQDICKIFEISKLLRHCKKSKCLNWGQFPNFAISNFQNCLPHGQKSLKNILWRKYNIYEYNINIILYILHIYSIYIVCTQCVLEGLVSVTEHLRGKPHKSQVLITSTLLVTKAYNIYQNTTKMHNTK